MVDHLARYARLSAQAKARDAQRAAADRAAEQREQADRAAASMLRPQFLAGPPDGCARCWEWRRSWFYWDGWEWGHREPVDPQDRPWPDPSELEPGDPPGELVEHCMCSCHGPAGHALPIIAIA